MCRGSVYLCDVYHEHIVMCCMPCNIYIPFTTARFTNHDTAARGLSINICVQFIQNDAPTNKMPRMCLDERIMIRTSLGKRIEYNGLLLGKLLSNNGTIQFNHLCCYCSYTIRSVWYEQHKMLMMYSSVKLCLVCVVCYVRVCGVW